MHQLAIIIPAFKEKYLLKALQSIEKQTDKRFQVYIGDDASPFDLKEIIDPFLQKNGWVYKRFEKNLGKNNLVGHWNRCVELSSEPWLWLFSDDDEMSHNCVESFYAALAENSFSQVFKFNFSIVNKQSEIIETNTHNFSAIDGFEFGKRRFERTLLNSAVEFVFSRRAFNREGGFVNFPSAWCSDDASWIAFSNPGKIAYIKDAKVFWRMSDLNISSLAGSFVKTKLEAASDFILWFNKRYKSKIGPSLFGEQIIWFRVQIENLNVEINFWDALYFSYKLKPNGLMTSLRTFNEIFARSFVSMYKKETGENPIGFKAWVSKKLPKF
jgi:glycosyltransferase involved in cell wall biosynthesis